MMKNTAHVTPFWSTASFGEPAETSPMELSALGEHLDSCKGAHSRLFALRCIAEAANVFIAARVVTTLVVVALLIGLALLVF